MIELLVVIAIIGVLIALLAPALEKGVERSRLAVCGENMHAISTGIHMYASEFNDALPIGPTGPSGIDPSRPFSAVGDNLAWIGATSQNNGLGVLTKGWCNDPKSFSCPFDDDPTYAPTFRRNLGTTGADARCSYMYRQLQQTQHFQLTALGNNAAGHPAKALLMDWQSEGPTPFKHTSHDYNEFLNILYTDGHIQSFPDRSDQFEMRNQDFSPLSTAYTARLDHLWVKADWAENADPASSPAVP